MSDYNKDYTEFLRNKQRAHVLSGFDIEENDLTAMLFPFQKFIVKRALKAGKYAIFADCGLGKTFMQIEWAKRVAEHTNRWVLILAPLAVKQQTIQESKKIKIHVQDYFEAEKAKDLENCTRGIAIANYEQLHNINTDLFVGVALDEASILKSVNGATKTRIIKTFKDTPYKLSCTATPSPNDPMELGNQAEFLDVMKHDEMLAMYFVHDGGKTSKWKIKGHALKSFYRWVGQWAIMISKPSDIGFDDTGYILPELNFVERQVITPKRDNGQLYNDVAVSATEFNGELRLTLIERMDQVADIVNNSDEMFLIACKLTPESDLIKTLIPDAVDVRGGHDDKYKEYKFLGFANNEFRVLSTKGKMVQYGLNYQNCHNIVVAALDFSFEMLYQLIRRCYRFGQGKQVNVYLITTDTMQNVIQTINTKQKQFEVMQKEMSEAVNMDMNNQVMSEKDYDVIEEKNEWYHIKRGDSTVLMKEIPDKSVGVSVFSPPFPSLYTYSSHIEDLGNCKDHKEFTQQFDFIIKELYRIMMDGRNVCVHCMDVPIQKGKEGYIGLRDFSGMLLDSFQKAGFIYHSRVTIWKDPVVEMQRTKALGLLHKQVKKDSTMSRVGIPDYVMIFRKDGERSNPVTNTELPVDMWQKYASPVWMDIDYSDTLNFRAGRDEKDEKHICPLQLPTIERLIHLYSNKGDTVFTPFLGIGSEVYQAVKMERKGIGFELKESYFHLAKKNIKSAVAEKSQIGMFDDLEPPKEVQEGALRVLEYGHKKYGNNIH